MSGPHSRNSRARVAPGSGALAPLVPPDFARQLAAASEQIAAALGQMLGQIGAAFAGIALPPGGVRADSGDPCGDGRIGGDS
jgi:hypothetical protein